jgi:anthranilate phosphoribosyltransferase
MQRLGAQHALVVWGRDGMDEISLGAATLVGELKDGEITEYEIHPEDFGLAMASNRALKVANAQESKALVHAALTGIPGTPHDIVVLNSAAALYAANRVGSIAEGVELARATIRSGAARAKLQQFVDATQRLGQQQAA